MIGDVHPVPALFIGRETELADIAAHLSSDALPAAVLVEGEAGIGKTTMCALVIEAAREQGFTTLVTRPVAAEADLTFSGLGDLLEPVLDHVLDAVPGPQARGLRVALLSKRVRSLLTLARSASHSSPCCELSPRNSRSWSSSTMFSGSTPRRPRSSPMPRGVYRTTGSHSSSPGGPVTKTG